MLFNHILLVDDNAMIQRAHERVVQSLTHQVSLAMSGAEALDILAKQSTDLIFMDMEMPEMNGIETTKEIRRRGISTPIIAVTGNDSSENIAACRLAGMNGFIAKPMKLALVQDEINRLF
jgi:CheY-like chemotaxis protein